MFQKKNFSNTWINLYLIVVILFTIVGTAMIAFDKEYFNGGQYLFTALMFALAIYLIKVKKIKPNYSDPMLTLGFIFSVIGLTSPIGLSLNIGLWGLGVVLFLQGLFTKK